MPNSIYILKAITTTLMVVMAGRSTYLGVLSLLVREEGPEKIAEKFGWAVFYGVFAIAFAP